jgi:hypothetical protein
MSTEWRVEALWRTDGGRWDNLTVERIAEAAEEDRDWLVSRWEDGAAFGADGIYLTGYVSALTAAEAAQALYDAVGCWMSVQQVGGYLVGVEAIAPEVAEHRAAKPTVPELVSASDAAAILDVSRQRVNELARTHPRFPAPLAQVATGPLWTRQAIEFFASVRDRKPGRPPHTDAA